jgi:2-haloalkanoic acid dehalogenase type II
MIVDVVTFDCYGTLIDWKTGIAAALAAAAEACGAPADGTALLASYSLLEREVEAERYRPYREVLAETARRVAAADGWEMPEATASEFAASLPSWRPFADTNRALSRLAGAGIRLGILSNVDDDLLAGTREHFAVDFDLVITAEQVRSYKPAHGHFLAARERLGDSHWLHAAQSYFHDVVPCAELGIPSAWINRHGAPPEGDVRPDYEFRDLAGLAAWLVP